MIPTLFIHYYTPLSSSNHLTCGLQRFTSPSLIMSNLILSMTLRSFKFSFQGLATTKWSPCHFVTRSCCSIHDLPQIPNRPIIYRSTLPSQPIDVVLLRYIICYFILRCSSHLPISSQAQHIPSHALHIKLLQPTQPFPISHTLLCSSSM